MKTTIHGLTLLILLFALAVPAAARQGEHEHEHEGAHDHQAMEAGAHLDLERPETGKWASDASLREGMAGIRDAFEPAHESYRSDEFDAASAAELADTVEQQVNFMFANCQLPADADAELHKLLAAALGAARSLRESDDLHQGLHQLHEVLQAYGEYFDHPGWTG